MFEGGLKCVDCHSPEAGKVVRPTGATCVSCHEPGYEKLLDGWKTGFTANLAVVDSLLHLCRNVDIPDLNAVRKRAELISKDQSLGVHNHAMLEGLLTTDRDWLNHFIGEHELGVNRALPPEHP